MAVIKGFVVMDTKGHFLNKGRTSYIKHSAGHTPYVHQARDLVNGVLAQEAWAAQAQLVFSAEYHYGAGSETTKDPVLLRDFLEEQLGEGTSIPGV